MAAFLLLLRSISRNNGDEQQLMGTARDQTPCLARSACLSALLCLHCTALALPRPRVQLQLTAAALGGDDE
ncbi:hypothetical protein ABZP36_032882 [Zizania latifolia]